MIINFNILEMLFTSKPKTWVIYPTARYWNVLPKGIEIYYPTVRYWNVLPKGIEMYYPTVRYWNVLPKVMEWNNENQLETNWASKRK